MTDNHDNITRAGLYRLLDETDRSGGSVELNCDEARFLRDQMPRGEGWDPEAMRAYQEQLEKRPDFIAFLRSRMASGEDCPDQPTDAIIRCLGCGNWSCVREAGCWACRECGAWDGDHHIAEMYYLPGLLP